MDDKKKKYIIIGAVVLVVLYFVWKNSQSGEDESKENLSNRQAARMATKDMSTVGTSSAVAKSAEDEEYQNLLDELKRVNNNELPAGATSYTAAQLRQKIKEIKALRDAYNQYAAEEDNEANQLTYEQLQDQNRGTVDDIIQLINEVKQRKQKELLQGLLDAFITTCNNYGNINNPAGAKRQEWDTSTLSKIMALPDSDLKVLSNMVKERKNELDYPDNYSAAKSRYYCRTSLYLAIPSGTLCSYRTGASVAQEFRKKMQSKGY